jgi:glycosyltransferase involved in cell wall biosynthesis
MKTIILDCRPLQTNNFNGVVLNAINWYQEIITKNSNAKIILWTNSRKSSKYLHLKSLLKSNQVSHLHTTHSNIVLTILFQFKRLKTIESILNIKSSKVQYFCADLRAFNTKQETKSNLYIHDLAFLKHPEFYSFKSRLYFYLINPKKTAHKATRIYTNSNFTKRELIKQLGLNATKIIIKSPTIKKLKTKPTTIKKQFLVLGAFQPRKRTEQIIQEFNIFNKIHTDYKLILVGQFDQTFSSYQLELNKNIILKTNISETEKTIIIKESIAIIYIPIFEGFGMPVLEAITYQKPIICSNLKVFKENFKNYPTYINSPSQLHKQLAKQII